MNEYVLGDFVGNNGVSFIEPSFPYINPVTGISQQKAVLKCGFCGKHFIAIIGNVKKGTTRSCGCYATQLKTKHNLYRSKLYRTFYSIIERCENPKDKGFVNYGGRGICLDSQWRNNFTSFYQHVSSLPNFNKNGYVIDRINNDKNYEPGNVRWVTYNVSNTNKRMPKHNKTGYLGVRYCKKNKAFVASITINKRMIHIKQSSDIMVAVRARNEYIKKNNLIEYKLNGTP
jgi:hypothetical protein